VVCGSTQKCQQFFAFAVEVTDDERQVAIAEINEQIAQYGLTMDDLRYSNFAPAGM